MNEVFQRNFPFDAGPDIKHKIKTDYVYFTCTSVEVS